MKMLKTTKFLSFLFEIISSLNRILKNLYKSDLNLFFEELNRYFTFSLYFLIHQATLENMKRMSGNEAIFKIIKTHVELIKRQARHEKRILN